MMPASAMPLVGTSCCKTYLAVGAALGCATFWSLLMVAAWYPQAPPRVLEQTLVRFAHWPFIVFLPGMVNMREGRWADIVPLVVSLVTWMVIGTIIGLAAYYARAGRSRSQ